MKPKDLWAFIGLSLAWGSSFFWVKIALDELGPFTLVALRLLLGAVGLAIFAYFTKPPRPSGAATWRMLLFIGLTNVAIPFVVTTWGQIFIDSAVASILLSSVPLFTIIVAQFMLDDDKFTGMRGLALLAGFAGVVILLQRDIGSGESTWWGYAAQLFGSFFYAFSGVLARKHLQAVPLVYQSLVPILFADMLIWLTVPFVESPIQLPATSLVWSAIMWLGFICSCFAYLFYYYLLHSIGPTRTSMVTYVFPVVGVALGVLFLGEGLDLALVAGDILILGSLYIVNRPTSAAPPLPAVAEE